MTDDEIERKMVGWIEPMPECSLHDLSEHGTTVQALTYLAGEPIQYSEVSHWLWYPCDVNATWHIRETEGVWMPATDVLSPLTSLDDAIKCVEARGMDWSRERNPDNLDEHRIRTWPIGWPHRDGTHNYTDNNHARALCMAAIKADGEAR